MLRIDGSKLLKMFVLCLAASVVAPVMAQEQEPPSGPVPVRVRHFEGVVTVQRASAGETSDAIANLPLEAGDRIWTEQDGRAELSLSDGTMVWLDQRTTIDIVALEDGRGTSSIFRLWGGTVLVWRPALATLSELRLDNGGGVVSLQHPGLARVDIDDQNRMWLSVHDGQASLSAGGLVETLVAGEQSYTEPGTAPATASTFSTAEIDDFAQWQQQRWSAYAETTKYVAKRDYVPQEVQPYAGELEAAGSWFYYDDFGSYAWRPTVAVDWSPYQQGRWVWGYGGWTWVSNASWGWATAHYGRWHHLPSNGWVWFPRGGYRSAWVSWYVGYGYVGWCPIGYYNRPFISIGLWFGGGYGYGRGYHGGYNYRYPSQYGQGGRAVAGRGYARGATASPSGWTLVDAADLGRGNSTRRAVSRTALPAGASQNAVTLSGALRQRSLGALQAGRQAIPRSTGSVNRPGLSSGSGTPRGGLSAGSGARPGLSGGADRGGPARARPAVRPGQTLSGGGADRARPLTAGARPRPGSLSSGRPATGVSARPRPGGLSSGISPNRGAIRRPAAPRPGSTVRGLSSGASRPTPGLSSGASRPTRGLSSGASRPTLGASPRGTGRPSIIRRPPVGTSSGSRPGGIARPPMRSGSAPGRPAVGRGAGGPRVSAPRAAGPRGRGGVASPRGRTGGRSGGTARRSGARRR